MFFAIDFRRIKKFMVFAGMIFLIIFAFVTAFKIAFPVKHLDLIIKYADKYGLDHDLVCAMIRAESNFDANAVSKRGAEGLMQIIKLTGDWGAGEIGLENYTYSRIKEPEINLDVGCWYIAKLLKQYGNVDTALAAYNAGSGTVSKWLYDPENSTDNKTLYRIPYPETKKYVEKVNTYRKIYKFILDYKIY
ncbi:lytic transglycosylase domain-containing protein [Anaeropeptidivorans aminofermentans]|jgi:soluble lytic murein transglycosylase|uniref:lytic transglycosylase domain-containing protein n=1 Tax=Anaeropeptidivorans aminofermentans TaxID=2934315 RepID=UPI0020246CBC|nr:lytic transglycosylase domain-containing protein [Anaeropeptidivorans aminofermentans]